MNFVEMENRELVRWASGFRIGLEGSFCILRTLVLGQAIPVCRAIELIQEIGCALETQTMTATQRHVANSSLTQFRAAFLSDVEAAIDHPNQPPTDIQVTMRTGGEI